MDQQKEKLRRQKNKEYQKSYYANHREQIIARNCQYQAEHKEEHREASRRHYARHREEKRAYHRRHYQEHLEEYRARQRKYSRNRDYKAIYQKYKNHQKRYI